MSTVQRPTSTPTPWRTAAIGSAGLLVLLWIIEIVDSILNNRLDSAGIEPRDTDGLLGILFAPLLHVGWDHLAANSIPLLVLSFLVLLSGVGTFVRATAIIWVIAGVGTWLTGATYSVHLGASSLIFGWVVFLVLRGFFHRNTTHILVGIGVFLFYGTMLIGVLPGTPGVSWQGHLFGAVGGAVAAWWGVHDKSAPSEPDPLARYTG